MRRKHDAKYLWAVLLQFSEDLKAIDAGKRDINKDEAWFQQHHLFECLLGLTAATT
jgi:hypothetical protein